MRNSENCVGPQDTLPQRFSSAPWMKPILVMARELTSASVGDSWPASSWHQILRLDTSSWKVQSRSPVQVTWMNWPLNKCQVTWLQSYLQVKAEERLTIEQVLQHLFFQHYATLSLSLLQEFTRAIWTVLTSDQAALSTARMASNQRTSIRSHIWASTSDSWSFHLFRDWVKDKQQNRLPSSKTCLLVHS